MDADVSANECRDTERIERGEEMIKDLDKKVAHAMELHYERGFVDGMQMQRTWVDLTDEEYDEIWRMDLNNKDIMDKTIAKLKDKNA